MEATRGKRPLIPPRTGATSAAFNVTPFMRLARTHAASTAADAMVAASLAGTIFFGAATSEARDQTFLYLLITMAPFAVVAPLIGPALDRARSGRRWIVIGSALVRALLCFLLIGRTDTWLLYPAAFAILVTQKGYGIARSSLVPAVVTSDEELVEANSKLQLLSGLMGFVGVVPAALLFTVFDDNPGPSLALAFCAFAVAAGLALRLPKVAVAPVAPTAEEKAELRSVGVLLAAAGMGLLRGIVGFLTLYFAFHFRETDQLGAFGIVAAVSVAGTLLGSVGAPRLRQVWPEERMLISVMVLTVGTGVLALMIGGVLGAALLGGVVGIAATAGKLAFDSIVQRDAPDANRGRLFAKFETRFQLIWVLGAMAGLVPLDLRLAFLAVALVSGFAAFSYVIGLSAWNHRTGATSSNFGRQAVLIDEAMTQGKDKAKHQLRTSTRAVTSRVRTRTPRRSRAGRVPEVVGSHPDPDLTLIAGPGIGAALPYEEARVSRPPDRVAPAAAPPVADAARPPRSLADDASPPPAPDADRDRVPPPSPTVFAPGPAPPPPPSRFAPDPSAPSPGPAPGSEADTDAPTAPAHETDDPTQPLPK